MQRKKLLLLIFFLTLFVFQQVQAGGTMPSKENLSLAPVYAPLPTIGVFVLWLDPTTNAIYNDIPQKCLVPYEFNGCGIIDPTNPQYPQNPVAIPVGGVVDLYLQDVLTIEMDIAGIPPEIEALKAQAVASRTVASWKAVNPPNYPGYTYPPDGTGGWGYINNSTQHQVFIPGSYNASQVANKSLVLDAISETQGQFLSYFPDGTNPSDETRKTIDAEFSNDIGSPTTPGNWTGYLKSVQEPISSGCDLNPLGNDWGMSQRGAIRWARGNQCADSSEGDSPWPVAWTDYRQILVHYYTGIDILNSSGNPVAPDNRWNLLNFNNNQSVIMVSGQTYNILIHLQNTSTFDWANDEITIGYRWSATEAWQETNVFVPATSKGLDQIVNIPILAPSTGGTKTLYLDVRYANNSNSWFSNSNWPDAEITIQVDGPTATFTPTLSVSNLTFSTTCDVSHFSYEICEVSNNGRLLHISGQAPIGEGLSTASRVVTYHVINSDSTSVATLGANVSYIANRIEDSFIESATWFDSSTWISTPLNDVGDFNFQNSKDVSFNNGTSTGTINLDILYPGIWYIYDLDIWLSLDGVYQPTSTPYPPDYTPPPPTTTPPPVEPTPDNRCVLNFLVAITSNQTSNKLLIPVQALKNLQGILLNLQLFHRVEDEILSQTPIGEDYIALYYEHSPEIVQILYHDPILRDEAIAVLQMWEPNLQALVDGDGDTVTITNAQVQAVQDFLDNLSAQASPELQQVIAEEQLQQPLEQFIGVTMDEALEYVEDGVSETPTPTITPTFTPSPTFTPTSGLLFADSFESGNFTAWGWASTNGGDLSVSTQSSAVGTYGMQALINDNAELVVYDHTPNDETHYSARFYFDPNDVQSPNDGFYLTALSSSGAGWVACLLFEPQGNDYYSLNLCGKNDAGNWLETESVLIADEWQSIEIEWKAATSSGANNGYIKLYLGDELAASIENIDNDTHSITTTSLGVLDTPTGASGIMYFDEFESRTGNHIGLHPNAPSVNPAPARPDSLFADNFESNNLNAWNPTLTKTDFGDLFTSSGSAYQSDYGLQALIDDTVVLKAIDSSPADESQYRARFYFHPNSLTMNNNTAHYIFDGYDTDTDEYLFRLELLYEGGSYKIRPRILKDSFSTITGSKYTISNAWHSIEIEWKKSTAVGANNGYLSLWIDGTLVGTISNVDNDLWTLDFVQLGATASIDSTTSGSMLFDNFISRRFTYIGQ